MTFILILLVIFLIAAYFLHRLFKLPKVGAMSLVSGGVKAGKSTFSVYLCIREFKRRHRSWKVRNFFSKVFRRGEIEEPLLYSNIPLSVPYVPVTKSLLLRKRRFNYGSVIYLSEASLVADSQCKDDNSINEQLLLFNKLIGHETKGGFLCYDTQSISDCHYSIKRCLSSYFYIHHTVKWIPFFLLAYVREDRYSADGSVIATNDDDVEKKLQRVIIPKSVWKKFDCYCYSVLTDDKPVSDNVVTVEKNGSLKAEKIVTFKEIKK